MSNTYPIINNPLLQDATVASQAVGVIQQTLGSLMSYTPTEVNTFLDWSYDAGDVVTLVKDGANYSMPIFTNYLNWNGAHDVTWGNSGNEERELPTVQERRSYGYGSTVAAVEQKVDENETEFHTYVEQTDEYISLIATETEVATARTLGKSVFKITSDAIDTEVSRATTAEGTLTSYINQMSSALSLVVTQTQDGNVVNTAAIILAINGGTGHSNAYIEADNIILNGSSIVATGEVESQALATAEIQCTYFYQMGAGGELGVDGEAHFYGPVYMEGTQNFFGDDGVGTLSGPTVSVNTLNLNAGEGGASYNLTTSNVQGMVTDLQLIGPTNNVYTLQKKTVANTNWADVGTFSRATSLGGAWSGSTLTVTATPQGNQYPVYHRIGFSGNQQSSSFSVIMEAQAGQEAQYTQRDSRYGYLALTGSGASAKVVVGPNSDGSAYVAQVPVGGLYTDGQTNGFNICHDSIALSESSQTLSSGESLTIYPRAKASVSASGASDISSKGITITAPTFSTETQSETITSNGTYEYTPSAGVDGMSRVTIVVNVSGGGGGTSTVRLRSGPGTSYSVIETINDGTELQSYATGYNYKYEWMPVKHGNNTGYIMSEFIYWTWAYRNKFDGGSWNVIGGAQGSEPYSYNNTCTIDIEGRLA